MSKLTALITTVRHGKKDENGQLEHEGKIQAAERAIAIQHLQGDIILFHSGEQRVKDTISLIGGNLHKNSKEELENFLHEKYDLQDYIVPTLHFLKDRQHKSGYFSEWGGELNNDKVTDFVARDSSFTDAAVAYSSEEMARNLAVVILTQIKFATLTSDEYCTNFINGTHEPVIMSFVYYLMTDFRLDKSPADFLAEIGGSVRYAEGFEIRVFQEGLELTSIKFKFRDFEKDIELAALENFVNS